MSTASTDSDERAIVTRLAIDCRMADWTGVGRWTQGLVRALVARGDIEVVQVVTEAAQAPVPDAEVVRSPGHPFSPAGGVAFSRTLRAVRPDVVHCMHFPTPIPARHPLVVTLHDLGPLIVPGVMPSATKRAVYSWWNRRAAKVADRITTVSRFSADSILELLGPVRPGLESRIRVVYPAADDFSNGPVGPLTGEMARLATAPYVLGFGTTKANKRLSVLLDAFRIVAEQHPEVSLLLVGSPAPDFIRAIAGTPAAERVHFLGRVDDAELRALYAGAAAFAFPSAFEGFGSPPLEALALGAPVVVAAAASLPEVVGEAALLVPPDDESALADALLRLLGDEQLRARLASVGPERAATFSWARAAEETAAIYGEIVA